MKNKALVLYFLLLLPIGIIFAQGEKILSVGRTAGELAVSSTGAATYMVPLVLPPGIKEVVPALALSYNSQGGNGVAGWGWNIAGLSTISRIGATLHHDGRIDPVDFDQHDRFALDGQRLILIDGDMYGADKSVYATENYSNIKVVANSYKNGEGVWTPSGFTVYYPDGSRAYYWKSGGLEWAISRWEDPQRNTILYTYQFDRGTLTIDKVYYGARSSNTTDHPNVITFSYSTKEQQNTSYVGGLSHSQPKLLNAITISTKGSLYRHYQLTHDTNSSGYERLTQVEEQTASEKKPNLLFSYDQIDGWSLSVEEQFPGEYPESSRKTQREVIDYDPFDHQIIPGDFNGDGIMDIVVKEKGRYLLYLTNNSTGQLASSIIQEDAFELEDVHYKNFLPSTYQTASGRILSQQGFITIEESIASSSSDDSNAPNQASSELVFTTHAYDQESQSLISYQSNIAHSHVASNAACSIEDYHPIPKNYYAGDFNGDGKTDVLAIEKSYKIITCSNGEYDQDDERPRQCDDQCEYSNFRERGVFLIDLDRQKKASMTSLGNLTINDQKDHIQLADFDGDGKAEIWKFSDGKVVVYTLSFDQGLRQLTTFENSYIDIDKSLLLGDYNGDGKTDLLVPKKADDNDWAMFFSTGSTFQRKSLFNGPLFYRLTTSKKNEYSYFSQDVNGDGKTDLVVYNQSDGIGKRSIGNINIFTFLENEQRQLSFTNAFSKTHQLGTDNYDKWGISIGFDRNVTTQQNTFYCISGEKIFQHRFTFDNQTESLLRRVSHKGLVQTIDYQPLGEQGEQSVYQADHSQVYPYININTALGLPLVEKVTATANGQTATQKFKYKGAVSHAGGLGFLGFMATGRTNSYGTNVRALWSVSQHDPQKRGAVTQSWTSVFNHLYLPNQTSQHSTYEYSTLTTEKGIFINVPTSILTQDGLMGFETLQTYTYDAYYNPSRILTERFSVPSTVAEPVEASSGQATLQGSTDQYFSYQNNPTATDARYHIGRLTEEISTETWGDPTSGRQASHTTTTQYTEYDNNLLKSMKLQGDDTKWLTEKMDYDAFGNLLSKVLSADGESDRSQSYTYTPDGRFLASSTDIEDLTTSFLYYNDGSLKSETDPFAKTTTYSYDAWQRLQSVTDYLGNANQISYAWDNFDLVERQDGADGSASLQVIDPWGRERFSGSKMLDEHWRFSYAEYDVAGRKVVQSEPYAVASAAHYRNIHHTHSLRNSTQYDAYGRVSAQGLATGKSIATTYSRGDPTTVVNDGYQEVRTTLDARGKIAQLTDPNGTIVYTYHLTGEILESNYDGHVVKVTYDGWGRKKTLSDPSAGSFSYTYDIFGQLTQEVSPWGTTDYRYDAQGKLDWKEQKGDNTNLYTDYSYDPTTQLLTREDTTDRWNGDSFVKTIAYDEHERPETLTESNDWASFSQTLSYDSLGRIAQEQRNVSATGAAQQSVAITHGYAANGQLDALLANQKKVWELKAENARGQATQVQLGNGITKINAFDALGFLEDTTHGSVFKLDLNYNKKKGVLNSRKQQGHEKEVFTHDSRNRLTQILQGTSLRKYEYDELGRMTDNKDVGEHLYTNVEDRYLIDSTYINAHGLKFYKTYYHQIVEYNIDRKAVSVHQVDIGRVDFVYNASGERLHGFYGNEEEAWGDRKYRKHYSTLFPAEITVSTDPASSAGKTVFYLGGDGYTAPVALINGEDHYLHRDHLGSILAISDSNGTVVEERHFDAWGQNITLKQNGIVQEDFNESLLLRGFTGHEHFTEVDLIHMNGRMYSPRFKRFLSPDNHIQDPFDTRSYDRKAYVWNNPLMASDPSGEIVWFVVAAAVVGGYMGGVQANGGNWNPFKWDWNSGSTLAGILGGAVIGGASAGIGLAATSGLTASGMAVGWASALGGAAGGAVSGGAMSLLPGGTGKFFQGLALGAVSGFAGGGAGFLANKHIANVAINGLNITSPVVKGIVAGGIGGAVGGYAGGFTGGLLQTGNLKGAHQAGLQGLQMGAGIGAVQGFATSYAAAKSQGLNPWSGKHLDYPSNDGAIEGTLRKVMLKPGTKIDRFGGDNGRYTSPLDTPIGQRSLSPRTDTSLYKSYEVIQSLPAFESRVSPYYYKPGGGIQYQFNLKVSTLVEQGYLRPLGN